MPIMNSEEESLNPSEMDGLSYLALGDSYTIGTGISEEMAWPNQLKNVLDKKSFKISELKIIAQNGWTTTDLLTALDKEELSQYDLVSLLIGVNNQFQRLSFTDFKTEFNLLLEQAIGFSGESKKLFVVSIPDYGVTLTRSTNQTLIANEINMYNSYIKDACTERGVIFVDITDISRDLGVSNNALSSDGLHPSAFQYAKWIELIGPSVENLLKEQ